MALTPLSPGPGHGWSSHALSPTRQAASPAAVKYAKYHCAQVLATSLSGDVAAALREHGSATLDEHCCYFRRPWLSPDRRSPRPAQSRYHGLPGDISRSRVVTEGIVPACDIRLCSGRWPSDLRLPAFRSEHPGRGDALSARSPRPRLVVFHLGHGGPHPLAAPRDTSVCAAPDWLAGHCIMGV
jgi:hypothetical protein